MNSTTIFTALHQNVWLQEFLQEREQHLQAASSERCYLKRASLACLHAVVFRHTGVRSASSNGSFSLRVFDSQSRRPSFACLLVNDCTDDRRSRTKRRDRGTTTVHQRW